MVASSPLVRYEPTKSQAPSDTSIEHKTRPKRTTMADVLLNNNNNNNQLEEQASDQQAVKCSAVHTLERDMPTFDYSSSVGQLRQRILAYCQDNPGLWSQSDLVRCQQDDWFLSRFLLRHKLDVEAALAMLKRAMRFRHESLFAYKQPQDFPAEFFQLGGLFAYEPDRKGNRMLYIRVKVHRKVPDIQAVLQGFLYFNIDRLDQEAGGKGISIVIDCSGAGLANADADLLLYLITTLVNYFPKGLSYFLVHELPWILKPFWLLAKACLSEEHTQLIKFSNSQTIFEYIHKENLPDFMGGTCQRDYRAPPANCTSLVEACKLWGIDNEVARSILEKFKQHLPAETVDRVARLLEEQRQDQEKEPRDHNK